MASTSPFVILYNQDYPIDPDQRKDRMGMWMMGLDAAGESWEPVRNDPEQFGQVVLTWGVKHGGKALRKGLRHVVMECGFLGDRILENFFVGFGGLNGAGRIPGDPIPGRGAPWYGELKPAREGRTRHRTVGICAQVPRDTSLASFGAGEQERVDGYHAWVAGVAKLCRLSGRRMIFRGHPSSVIPKGTLCPPDAEDWTERPKAEFFDEADLLVAFNSNVLVEGFIAGVDVLPAHQGSLAWSVRSWWDTPARHTDRQRQNWLDLVATHQWSRQEIANGVAWAWVRSRL